MTREFPDELLSAFLDDELPPAERARVEQHLAASEADRQLLAELKSLRSDVAALPLVTVSSDFADRVVRAALAEVEKHDATAAVTALAPPGARASSRKWKIGAAVASAAALAACFLLVVQPWRQADVPQPGPLVVNIDPTQAVQQIATASDQFLNSLRGVVPADGEAVVLRLRVSKDVPLAEALDAALGKAGIASLASNLSGGAALWQEAYRRSLEAKYGPSIQGAQSAALADSTVAAAEAVFIEAPLERLQGVFADLSAGVKQPFQLSAEGKLALAGRRDDQKGEGEYTEPKPFAQRLNAEFFRLEKKLADAANAAINPQPTSTVSPPQPVSPQQLMRVLILVEVQ